MEVFGDFGLYFLEGDEEGLLLLEFLDFGDDGFAAFLVVLLQFGQDLILLETGFLLASLPLLQFSSRLLRRCPRVS